MRKLILILSLIFTVTLSSPSYAKWEKVMRNSKAMFYIDVERIRKVDGYVYWWNLVDYLKPTKNGTMSAQVYIQGDCKLFRERILNDSYYNEPMGRGEVASSNNKPDKDWQYPSPYSVPELILKKVCALKK